MQEFIDFLRANSLLSVAWIALFITIIYMTFKQMTAKYKSIDPSQLTLLINHEEATIVDVRSRDEFQLGHIAGAVHSNAIEIEKDNLAKINKHKDMPVIVVSKNEQDSAKSAEKLIKNKYTRVYVLRGGLMTWTEAKLPLVRGK